jgi:hypothetical protein
VESHELAGLHIHVDRASFSPEGLARLFTVVNHTDNALHAFSRRGPSTSYCRFVPQSLEAWRSAMRSAGKYSAAFLHTGYPTVELRLFRSTVLLHRLLAALECAEALWRFAMHSTLPPTGADWAHWVAEQPDYVLLTCELRAQGVLPAVAPVYAAAQPLSKPVPPPPPVVRATPAPTPSARVEVGTSPSGSTYYWEPATQRVVYRERGTGTYQPTSLGWQTSQGEVSTWIRTQLQNRGLWTPPAPPAPEAYDLGRDPESIVPYRFHLATQRVQYGASGAWADSDYHRQSEFADTHEGRSRRWAWITAQLARHGVTLTVPSAPAVEAGV